MAIDVIEVAVGSEAAEVFAASASDTRLDIERMITRLILQGHTGGDNRRLYDQDFYDWTQKTATLIRAGQWDYINRDVLAEELSDLGVSLEHAVSSDLCQVLIHLLKWQYQPAGRVEGHSWRDSIVEHRDRIDRLCTRSPSLRGKLPAMFTEEYPRACRRASIQTGLPRNTFPEPCRWTLDEILDADFWPEEETPQYR
jgi:Domain of unknown function DUF29